MNKKRLLFISILGTLEDLDLGFFSDLDETGDDCIWVANRFREWNVYDQISFETVRVACGEELPEPEDVDAVIVGGSIYSINDDEPWQRQTMSWLARWRTTGRATLGICGGHQMMSVMEGAKVTRRTTGGMSQSAAVTVTEAGQLHPLFAGLKDHAIFHFNNFDHVSEQPGGSTVLAHDDESPALALDYGGNWLSVQFHPEASLEVMLRVCQKYEPENARKYRPLPEAPKMLVNFLELAGMLPEKLVPG